MELLEREGLVYKAELYSGLIVWLLLRGIILASFYYSGTWCNILVCYSYSER